MVIRHNIIIVGKAHHENQARVQRSAARGDAVQVEYGVLRHDTIHQVHPMNDGFLIYGHRLIGERPESRVDDTEIPTAVQHFRGRMT